ncbi:hypothetical protein [Alteromonas sp. 14N.309.X.WAT.G.H12]|uniref:hypothetical protein n=1 Tax=Alteromonas sp. 14N.309.X.WAT.G.H12 TaxID=3120824 RepID=UPI002FD251AE
MTQTPTLSDFLLAHANMLTLSADGRATFASQACETAMRDRLLSLFDTPHTLKAPLNAPAPLIPNGYYTVSQSVNPYKPEWITLNAENGMLCLPLIDFFNAFHEQALPALDSPFREELEPLLG